MDKIRQAIINCQNLNFDSIEFTYVEQMLFLDTGKKLFIKNISIELNFVNLLYFFGFVL